MTCILFILSPSALCYPCQLSQLLVKAVAIQQSNPKSYHGIGAANLRLSAHLSSATANAGTGLPVVPARILVAVTLSSRWKSNWVLLVWLTQQRCHIRSHSGLYLHSTPSSGHCVGSLILSGPSHPDTVLKQKLCFTFGIHQTPKAELIPICREWGTGVRELGNLEGWKRLKNQGLFFH